MNPPQEGFCHIQVGCELRYQLPSMAPLTFILQPQNQPTQRILKTERRFDPLPERCSTYRDPHHNEVWRILALAGEFRLYHNVLAEVVNQPDAVTPQLRRIPLQDLPDDTLVYTLPSRYCPSDLFIQEAWARFGEFIDGWAQVQAICDWLHANVEYRPGSNSSTSAFEAFHSRQAVCRDFAHLGVSFCRALSIPARYVCGYLPEIGVQVDDRPMDFHAWFEVYLGHTWHTFDARHNTPRVGRVLIGVGRDAADVAFSTIYGQTQLTELRVWANQIA